MRELSQFTEPELRKELSRRRKLRKEVKRKAHGEPKRRKGRGCGLDRDEALKKARGYTDPSTFVRRDGSEKLAGQDWKWRIQELEQRSGARCEYPVAIDIGEYERCWQTATDADHKIKRSVRRDDRLSNLQHLCREHHNLKHPEFRVRSGKAGAVPALESSKKAADLV